MESSTRNHSVVVIVAVPAWGLAVDDLLDIPDDQEIVAYCRGPYCVYADDAVRHLTAKDRRAVRLREGFPEW